MSGYHGKPAVFPVELVVQEEELEPAFPETVQVQTLAQEHVHLHLVKPVSLI